MSTPTDPQEVARMVAWLRNGDLPLSTCVAIADTLERLAAQVLPEGHTILDGQEWLHDYTFPRSGSMSDSITVRLVPVAAGTAPTPDWLDRELDTLDGDPSLDDAARWRAFLKMHPPVADGVVPQPDDDVPVDLS